MSIQTEINRLNAAKETLTDWMDEQEISYEEGANLTSIANTIADIKPYHDTVPINAIIDYEGDTVPDGYEIVANPTYSTTEQKTGETWINGKPLYRKVIEIPVSSITGAGTMISHGVTDLEYALPPKCSWYDTQAYTWRNIPSSYFGSLDWASQVLVRTDGNLYFEIGSSALTRLQTKGRDLSVVIEYTKTTD